MTIQARIPEILSGTGDYATLGGFTPIKARKVSSWIEDIVDRTSSGTAVLIKDFRYSWDGYDFSDWQELSEPNLQAIVTRTESTSTITLEVFVDSLKVTNGIYSTTYLVGDKFPYRAVSANADYSIDYDQTIDSQFIIELGDTYNNAGDIIFYEMLDSSIRDLYLQFRVTLSSGGPVDVYSITPVADLYTKGGAKPPPMLCTDSGCRVPVFYDGSCTSSFNVNQTSSLEALYIDLNEAINRMAGVDAEYLRFTPIKSSEDVLFHEWTLYNVDPKAKCIRVVVANNEFPDAKQSYSPSEIDFEMPFEVNISKKYFESLYGESARPQKRDIIFIPSLNRLYEVGSSYLFREFMNIGAYYKVYLTKYSPRSAAYMPKDIAAEFDEKILSSEDAFDEKLRQEIKKTASLEQLLPKDNKFDPGRDTVTVESKQEKIINYYTTVATHYYDMAALHAKKPINTEKVAVTYKSQAWWPKDNDRSISAWFRSPVVKFKSYIIDSFSVTSPGVLLITFINHDFMDDQWLILYNDDAYFRVKIIAADASDNNVTARIPDAVLAKLETDFPSWQTMSFKARHYQSKNIIDGVRSDVDAGYRVDLHSNAANEVTSIEVNHNDVLQEFFLEEALDTDRWYAVFINMSNLYRKMTIDFWKIQWDIETNTPSTSVLSGAGSFTSTLVPADRSASKQLQIIASETHLTNIRLWNTYCSRDKQSEILNQNKVTDAQNIIIADNGEPMSYNPSFGDNK